MPRPLMTLPALVAAAVLTACSAGTTDLVARDAGHGGVADVLKVLQEQGLPCETPQPRPSDPAVAEEQTTCVLDGDEVEIFHFFTPEQAEKFRVAAAEAGRHGAYAETWAARTDSRDAAEQVASAVKATSVS